MSTLIQKIHPAPYPGRLLALAGRRQPLFSRQGMWGQRPRCTFLGSAQPRYLPGLTPSEVTGFIWGLNAGLQAVQVEGSVSELPRFCAPDWPQDGPSSSGLPTVQSVNGMQQWLPGSRAQRRPEGPAAVRSVCPPPILAASNARLKLKVIRPAYHCQGELPGGLDAPVSIRLPQENDTT